VNVLTVVAFSPNRAGLSPKAVIWVVDPEMLTVAVPVAPPLWAQVPVLDAQEIPDRLSDRHPALN
jgi:hypothetical protein